jgi:uncharacterized protein (DUF58 family)
MSSSTATIAPPGIDWDGPGAPDAPRRRFAWRRLLWMLVFPPRRHRISPTLPGIFLMALAMGIGTAAYNTASNILFITLSLLLACLLLSGLMSWFNFMGVCWRVRPEGPWRAGHETMVTIEVRNRKSWLPTYGLWFDLAFAPKRPPPEPAGKGGAEKEIRVREILAAAEREVTHGRMALHERLEAKGGATLDWVVKPAQRGETTVELAGVGSLFPFGFLKKTIGAGQRQTVLVWPAQVDYQAHGGIAALAGSQGSRTGRIGHGEDLLALRKYTQGDSHRLIHWKASARLRQLMVRQFAAESHDGYVLQLDTPATVWSRPEQFELLCGLAGTFAEDLFAAGRLRGLIVNGGAYMETRRVRDLEAFLDQLAILQPLPDAPAAGSRPPLETGGRAGGAGFTQNVVTFAPEGARGVAAYVDGSKTASA